MRHGKPDTYFNKFTSLQFALYASPFFAALSFAGYLFAAIYVNEDKKSVDIAIASMFFAFFYYLKKILIY